MGKFTDGHAIAAATKFKFLLKLAATVAPGVPKLGEKPRKNQKIVGSAVVAGITILLLKIAANTESAKANVRSGQMTS